MRSISLSPEKEPRLTIYFRSCEDLANVKVCRETFNLLFYEADNEQDTPQWNTLHYKKVR